MNPLPDRPSAEDDELMRQYLAEAGDPHVAPEPAHAAHVRSLLLEQLGSQARPRPARGWTTRVIVGAGLLAAILMAVAFFTPPTIAWAQVMEALRTKSWVHGTLTGPDGKELGESWLSSNRHRAAGKFGPEITFHDHELKILSKYIAAEETV